MAMRRAELYIMNVKRKALVPDARGNMRDLCKHAERKGAGARVGTWSKDVEKKRVSSRPLQGERVAVLQSQQRGNHPLPPPPSLQRAG
jgi:hypothetical protein